MFFQCVRMAVRELAANWLRTALTTLGIVIGVFSVVVVITVMQSVTTRIMEDVSQLGQNMVMVHPKRLKHEGRMIPLETEDAEAIERQVPGVAAVAPVAFETYSFSANGNDVEITTFGTTNAYLRVRTWKLAMGRAFSPAEEAMGGPVCLLGDTTRRDLFGQQNPIGATVRTGRFVCRVIGILANKGNSNFTEEVDKAVLLPIKAYHKRLAGNRDVDMFFVGVLGSVATNRVIKSISTVMRERRHVLEGSLDNFSVTDIREAMKTAEGTAYKLALGVAGLAAISLIVGGIGIMNIMLVSVTERTREIGIRLAVGAESRDILMQFLIEAMVLSLAGGLGGMAIGVGVATLIASLIGVQVLLNLEVLALGFAIPALIGIAFGFFPALRASRLDPIEALRYE